MICGLDEEGRGPLAGPVCAAAVILPDGFPLDLLADSKKLKPKQREDVRCIIVEKAAVWGVGWATHVEIDKINILQASLLAMRRAFDFLLEAVSAENASGFWPEKIETETAFGRPFGRPFDPASLTAVADGLYVPELPVPCTAVVKADNSIPAVMAASILAKTARDSLMEHYGILYPQYGYEKHKGYPTVAHRKSVLHYGPSPIQRLTFNAGNKEFIN